MSKTRTSPWLILRQAQDERCNFKWLKKLKKLVFRSALQFHLSVFRF
ncbi:MAG: hypothetical protein AAB091_05000 [Elusimicrobiota bacterium]